MTQEEQIKAFAIDLRKLLDHYGKEYDLNGAAAIGVMMMQIWNLRDDLKRQSEEQKSE